MINKKLKIFLLAIFSVVLGIICISVFSSKNNETLYLSKNVNKFKLITHSNEKFDEKFFSNYPSLIFFGFLNCPDVCPFTLTKISEIIEKLKDKSELMRFYFVTVDPKRDTIEDLKEYLNAFHPKIIGVTGSNIDIEKFLKYMYVYKKEIQLDNNNYTIDHSSQIFLFNKNGSFFGTLSTNEKDNNILGKISKLLNGA
ncbi:MAG: SCO family protein [Alphaproteobacteria bacterium TMED194]|nr:MAG: SCO family protein [Alphaproteobacteria bacterium TMED194]|tara:strand:+ start:332 stop:925 length:594 start_codon:yes stop_codon:yes gene_type:complete